MLAKVPEKWMRLVRWMLTLGWFVLIASLFYDPFSAQLTASGQVFAAKTPNDCYSFQGECRPLTPYPIGARIFWGMVLPAAILTLLILGHEAWRRICPLSFVSQIPRRLGWQRKRTIGEQAWLSRNGLYLQMGLLFLGLNLRLLLVNSDRTWLGVFLLLTLLVALTVGLLFDGKTWCNYFCPMAPVQMIYSEPRGLLGSAAHTAPAKTITQSMCRTIDRNGVEKSACVACKSPCIDIDAEAAYWDGIRQPDRKLLYYGYVGLVIGFYLYFWLYSGNWSFLSAGVWQDNQFATLLSPGFYIAGWVIPIPKIIAVPLTLTVATGFTYAIGLWLETRYKRINKRRGYPISVDQLQSRLFAVATFTAFNLLFFLGVRPTLGYLPSLLQQLVSWLAVIVSSFWLTKTWRRSAWGYGRERDANLLRRQLHKLGIDFAQHLEGRSIEQLNPDELYALAKVLPGVSQEYPRQIYSNILREAFEQQRITPKKSLDAFQPMRQNLGLDEAAHWAAINQLQLEAPHLFEMHRWQIYADTTIFYRRDAESGSPQPSANQTSTAQASTAQASTNQKPAGDTTVYRPHQLNLPPYSPSDANDNERTTRLRPDDDDQTRIIPDQKPD